MGIFETNYFSQFSVSSVNIVVYLVVYFLLFILASLFLFFNYKVKVTQRFVGTLSLILLSGFPPSPLFFVKVYSLYYVFLKFGVIVLFLFMSLVVVFWYSTFCVVMLVISHYECIQYFSSLFTRRFRVVNIVHYFCIIFSFLFFSLWLTIVV